MIMSPCSKSGRCVGFYKDLRILLKNACLSVLTASYLEDGRVLAKGEISVKHLVRFLLGNPKLCSQSVGASSKTQDRHRKQISESQSMQRK